MNKWIEQNSPILNTKTEWYKSISENVWDNLKNNLGINCDISQDLDWFKDQLKKLEKSKLDLLEKNFDLELKNNVFELYNLIPSLNNISYIFQWCAESNLLLMAESSMIKDMNNNKMVKDSDNFSEIQFMFENKDLDTNSWYNKDMLSIEQRINRSESKINRINIPYKKDNYEYIADLNRLEIKPYIKLAVKRDTKETRIIQKWKMLNGLKMLCTYIKDNPNAINFQ